MIHYRISRDYTACGAAIRAVVSIGDEWNTYPKALLHTLEDKHGNMNTFGCPGCVRSDVFCEAIAAVEMGMYSSQEWHTHLVGTWKGADDA